MAKHLVLLVKSSLEIFDRLEELSEVSLSETTAARSLLNFLLSDGINVATYALDDLDEDGGAISKGLGEDLHEDALVILVDQEAELLALLNVLSRQRVDSDALGGALVVAIIGLGHELHASDEAAVTHLLHGLEDVVGLQGKVLDAGAAVLLQVGLNLRLSAGAEGGLVHGQKHSLVIAGKNHGVQAAVNSANVLGGELTELMEPGEAGQVVHRGEQVGHVAHAVINVAQTVADVGGGHGIIIREKHT